MSCHATGNSDLSQVLTGIYILDAVTVVLYNMMQEFNKMEHVPLIEVIKV